jgi:hypothetical protein
MSAGNVDFHEVAELASHLTPEDQIRLAAWIGAGLGAAAVSPGSATAVLCAIGEPPHLSGEDVGELERAIADGELSVRRQGVFDDKPAR